MRTKLFFLVLAILGVFTGCNWNSGIGEKHPIRVEIEVAGEGVLHNTTSYVGIIEASLSSSVSFNVMGTVTNVLISEGQPVTKGQTIAVMDDTQAKNLLASAQASLDEAKDAQVRYGALHDKGSLPEATWISIQSKVTKAQAAVDMAQKNLNDCILTAPVSGIIGKKYVSAGETALPSQVVATILDINKVKVKVSIPEAEIGDVHKDTKSDITIMAIGKSFKGGKAEKGIVADPLTHTYTLRILLDNPDKNILPGMVADVRLIPEDSDEIIISLPLECIQCTSDGIRFVWTVNEAGLATRKDITTGKMVGERVVITSGLSVGEKVIVKGCQKTGEGTKVIY